MSEITSTSSPLPSGTIRRTFSGYAGYVFLVLFCINVLNNLDRYVLTGAANVVAKELDLSIDQIGYLSSAFIIVFTIGVLPLGIWADRAKRKNVIAFSVAVWSLATAFTALASNFATLFLSRMVLGFGEAGYSPASAALMSDYFHRKKRAKVMGWWAIGTLVGLMMGIIIGGVVAGIQPGAWRWAFVFTGIPGLLLALIAWRLREPRRNQADEDEPESDAPVENTPTIADEGLVSPMLPTGTMGQFKALLRIKTVLVLIGMQVFTFFVLSGTVTYLSIFLQQKDTLGLSSAQAGLFSGIGIVLAGMIGMILGGYLSDWLNRRYVGARVLITGLSFLVSAPAYILSVLIAVNTHNLALYTVFFVLTTILLNINSGPSGAAIQDVVPSWLRASAVAISLFVGHLLGDAFAPALVGILARSFDPTGQHFAHNMAGHDLTAALMYTYPTSLVVAGLIGIYGSRWMKKDMEAAQRAEKAARG